MLDAASQRRTMFMFVFVLAATFVGSYFLGLTSRYQRRFILLLCALAYLAFG